MFGINLKGHLISAATGGILGAALSVAGVVTVYEKLIVPGREAAVEERVTRDVAERIAAASELAAAKAIDGERIRRQAAIDAAMAGFEISVSEREERREAELAELARENADYARALREAGKSCPYDADIERYLDGVRAPAR